MLEPRYTQQDMDLAKAALDKKTQQLKSAMCMIARIIQVCGGEVRIPPDVQACDFVVTHSIDYDSLDIVFKCPESG